LAGVQTDERRLKLIRDAKPGLENVTPADVQLDGEATVTERPPLRSPQKVAKGTAQVFYQRTRLRSL
jgi:hypothetical protein